jgi:hypothetical protein
VNVRSLGFHSYLFDGVLSPACVLQTNDDPTPGAPVSALMLGEAGAASLRVADSQAWLPKDALSGATWRLVFPTPETDDANSISSPTP